MKVELGCLSTQTQVTLCILLLFSIFILIVGEGIIKLVLCEALNFVVLRFVNKIEKSWNLKSSAVLECSKLFPVYSARCNLYYL